MVSDLVTWLAIAAGATAAFVVVQFLWLSVVLAWEDRATVGLGYWGRSPDDRERFRRALRIHALLLRPVISLLARSTTFTFDRASFRFQGIAGPKGTCDRESFERGASYRPSPGDVFVVTQMRCGTTWMQHLVYQLLHRGEGDLVGRGLTLPGVSPWLESRKTVPVEGAPLLGTERPSKLVKTHFPVGHCPWDPDVRYVYVTRHPVSCFASCVDFISANAGAMAPSIAAVEDWFCSGEMWWGPWPDHVAGWWRRAAESDNVLFIHFEEMKSDLEATARRVTDFLGLEPLSDAEMEPVLRRCSFDYMQTHDTAFEMHPPHLFSVEADLFRKGSADRHGDVPEAARRRVAAWCAARLDGCGFPLADRYPDVASLSGEELSGDRG